jgi:NAD(P)H dehydrogenase (quinone)
VLEVGGSPPEDFEQIVRRYVAASALTKRTIGAKLRAALHLIQAAGTRAPEIDTTTPGGEPPTISHAVLAVDSPTWQQSHHREPPA